MKKLLVLAGILASGVTVAANQATAIQHNLAINATVQAGCSNSTPTGTTGFNTGATTFTVAVTGTTQVPASGTLTFGALVCTTTKVKVSMSATNNGLYIPGQTGSLDKRMNYNATARLNGTAMGSGYASMQGTPFVGPSTTLNTAGSNTITIDITFPTIINDLLPQGALTAGTYTDTLAITIDGVSV